VNIKMNTLIGEFFVKLFGEFEFRDNFDIRKLTEFKDDLEKTLDLLRNNDLLTGMVGKEGIELSLQTRLNQVNILLTIAIYDETGLV